MERFLLKTKEETLKLYNLGLLAIMLQKKRLHRSLTIYVLLEWGFTALLELGAAVIALKFFKLNPLWAVAIGMVVFTVLNFHIPTHAVLLNMPPR